MKNSFKHRARRILQHLVSNTLKAPAMVGARNVDPYVHSLVDSLPHKERLNDPEFFVGLLRQSFLPYRTNVKEVKRTAVESDATALRFERLVETLQVGIPPLRAPVACEMASIADDYLGNTQYQESWGADVAWHFRISSSFPKKGRLLDSLIRFMRPSCCVEAGTAYGMSAVFMLYALEKYCEDSRLYTVEAFDPQYSLSESLLSARFGDKVRCYHGLTVDTLPAIVGEAGTIDFFVHDAGHSRNDYVNDFNSVVNSLKPGGIVLFDDIRWDDRRFCETPPRCYEGWREVVSHPRVCHAVEVGSNMGLLRLST